MAQNREDLLVWWIPSKDDGELQASEDAVTALPDYLADEALSLMGRAGRGRLWISSAIQPTISGIDWDKTKPCAELAEKSGGIVFYKKDIDTLGNLPGFVTDLQMNVVRELR